MIFSSVPNSPSSPCAEKFFPTSNSHESLLRNEERDRPTSLDESRLSISRLKAKELERRRDRPTSLDESRLSISRLKAKELERSQSMTSPAINGQKDNGKNASTSSAEEAVNSPSVGQVSRSATSSWTAWWRVFKFAKLLMQQGC